MIMKKILFVMCCIKLSNGNLLLTPAVSLQYSNLAANGLGDFDVTWPSTNGVFQKSETTRALLPETSTASRTIQKFKKHNAYKNRQGYTISEVYDTKHANNPREDYSNPHVIPDSRFVYHSLTNPLFRSKSLNLQSQDDQSSTIGDIHKITNPFESKWIFRPGNKLLEKHKIPPLVLPSPNVVRDTRNSAKSPLPPLSLVDLKLNTSKDFGKELKVKFSNSSLEDFKRKFSSSPVVNKTSILDPKPNYDQLEVSMGAKPVSSLTNLVNGTTTEKSFYSYNFQEIKTGDGKTQGVVQIYDNNGLKENVLFNEKGIVDDKLKKANSSQTNVQKAKDIQKALTKLQTNNTISQKGAVKENATGSLPSQNQPVAITTYSETQFNNYSDNGANVPVEEFQYNQPAVRSFATPEFILFDFLGQLNTFPYIPSSENFVTNELNTFDESVTENAFFYSEK